MKVYLASPFFNPQQLSVVEKIEDLASSMPEYELYSPRKDGILIDMTPEQRKKASASVFRTNCKRIVESDLVIAVIDGRDQGTIFEIGYASAFRHIKIVTYSDEKFGVNVMLRYAVHGHVRGTTDLESFLRAFIYGDDALLDYQDFNEVTT